MVMWEMGLIDGRVRIAMSSVLKISYLYHFI